MSLRASEGWGKSAAVERLVMPADLARLASDTRGFMPEVEGMALYRAGRAAGVMAKRPLVMMEIGAWCGKSTVYLGAAARDSGGVLFSLDHHRGSEEQQQGWDHFDEEVVDPKTGRIDTLSHWRRTVELAGLEDCVVGIIGNSPAVARYWTTPLDLCFVDGGHSAEAAWADFEGWGPLVHTGGLLAIHDVFPDPRDGGRPPYEIYRAALDVGEWQEYGMEGSLRVLVRTG
ncbi:MAG: class I SAM-dependent methyltransferase [Acidimicrobiales bacterium]